MGNSQLRKLEKEEKEIASEIHIWKGAVGQYREVVFFMEARLLGKLASIYRQRACIFNKNAPSQRREFKDLECLTVASSLYNAAIARLEKEGFHNDLLLPQILLNQVWMEFGMMCPLMATFGLDGDYYEYAKVNKEDLQTIRAQSKTQCDVVEGLWEEYEQTLQRPKDMKLIEAKIIKDAEDWANETSKSMITYIGKLIVKCINLLGPPAPFVRFCFFAMGSLSRGEMTPYSDLEFGILVDNESEDVMAYFRKLTHLFQLHVLDLGETLLPSMSIPSLNDFYALYSGQDWFYDDVTPSGFSLDGAMPHASKTPLGRKQQGKVTKPAVELIATPSKMAEHLSEERLLKEGYHLADVLSNTRYIYGEESLHTEYENHVQEKLQFDLTTTRIKPLLEDLQNLKPDFQNRNFEEAINVKRHLYRFLTLTLMYLKWRHQVSAKDPWTVIRQLGARKEIDPNSVDDFLLLYSICYQLRMMTYHHYERQKEMLSLVPSTDDVPPFCRKTTKLLMRQFLVCDIFADSVADVTGDFSSFRW